MAKRSRRNHSAVIKAKGVALAAVKGESTLVELAQRDLASMLARLAVAAAQTPPMPYRLATLPETHW